MTDEKTIKRLNDKIDKLLDKIKKRDALFFSIAVFVFISFLFSAMCLLSEELPVYSMTEIFLCGFIMCFISGVISLIFYIVLMKI